MTNELEKWVKDVEETAKMLEKLPSKDRLETCASITTLHRAISGSLHGWSVWLKNASVLDQLSEEELKETFLVFKKLAKEFLDLDLKMSRAVMKKQRKGFEGKREDYVS